MVKNKILVALGTRPELIKLAPVINRLHKSKIIDLKICYTGQHKSLVEMSSDIFKFKPDFSLNIMKKKCRYFPTCIKNTMFTINKLMVF